MKIIEWVMSIIEYLLNNWIATIAIPSIITVYVRQYLKYNFYKLHAEKEAIALYHKFLSRHRRLKPIISSIRQNLKSQNLFVVVPFKPIDLYRSEKLTEDIKHYFDMCRVSVEELMTIKYLVQTFWDNNKWFIRLHFWRHKSIKVLYTNNYKFSTIEKEYLKNEEICYRKGFNIEHLFDYYYYYAMCVNDNPNQLPKFVVTKDISFLDEKKEIN